MKLDGLNVVLAVRSPGNMAQTKWDAAVYLDARANDAQREALTKIFAGQAAGHPPRLASHVGKVLGVARSRAHLGQLGTASTRLSPTRADPSRREGTTMSVARLISLGSFATLGLAAWAYTVRMAATMGGTNAMGAMAMPMSSWPGFAMLMLMWVVMMVAMMAPAVAPSYLLFTRLDRAAKIAGLLDAAAYLVGYLAIWSIFGIAAAAAQYALGIFKLMSGGMALSSHVLWGAVLIAAGAYQWSPLKARCVARCRSPLGFLMNEWRGGPGGALLVGWRYGLSCVGCCWLLMCLMFVVGAMNLAWALVLSAYVLLERLVPFGRSLDGVVGLALAAWGVWLIVGPGPG